MVLCVHNSSYNYMLIHLKLKVLLPWSDYVHVVLYKPQINVCHFLQDVNLDTFFGLHCYQCLINVYIGSTLCVQIHLQFYTIVCAYVMA